MRTELALTGRALLGTPLQTISAKATITHSLAIERGDELVYVLLRASYLRAGDAHRIAGCGGKVRTQAHRLRQDRAAIRCLFNSKPEGAGARDGDPARDTDRDAGDARVHRPKLPASPAWATPIPLPTLTCSRSRNGWKTTSTPRAFRALSIIARACHSGPTSGRRLQRSLHRDGGRGCSPIDARGYQINLE